MEAKTSSGAIAIYSFFFIFFFLLCSVSTGLKYQTLSLSRPPRKTPKKLDHLSWNQPSVKEIFPEMSENGDPSQSDDNFLVLPLNYIDATASSNMTLKGHLKRRLHLDNKRVESIFYRSTSGQKDRVFSYDNNNGNQGGAPAGGAMEFNSSILSGVEFNSGLYYTRLMLGAPPQLQYLIIDTAADLTWTQCSPCEGHGCYDQLGKVFDPRRSRSFAPVPCNSETCQEYRKLQANSSSSPKCSAGDEGSSCPYEVSFRDGSSTKGELVTETLGFRTNYIEKVAMGCGHDNQGNFGSAGGLLGLGRGPFSFPMQTQNLFGGKFSYCLAFDHGTDSNASNGAWLMFGDASVSRKTVFAPLLKNPNAALSTFYFVGLTGFGVGGQPLKGINPSMFAIGENGDGGVIVDSGTVISRIRKEAYAEMRDAFVNGTKGLKRAEGQYVFDTCYDFSGMESVAVPEVELYFGKVSVALPANNFMVALDDQVTYCLAFAPSNSAMSIIGNLQQQGFRVAFDLMGCRVGFAPDQCT